MSLGNEIEHEGENPQDFKAPVDGPVERADFTEAERERFEAILGSIREVLLKEHKVNEGNNGVIFKVSIESGEGIKEVKEYATKLLKVGDFKDLHNEFENLKAAHAILEKAIAEGDNREDYAGIPEAHICEEISANPEIKQHLLEEGVNVSGQEVGVLLMDWVEGEDLATHLFKEVLKRKNSEYVERGLKMDDFNQLHGAVGYELEFAKPGGKATREGDRIFEQRKVEYENEAKVYKFLKKEGYVFPPKTVDQIKNTLELLKKSGLSLWDSHARNIMIDENAEHPYLIDFAPQKQTIGVEAATLDPHALVRSIEPLTRTPEEDLAIEQSRDMEDFEKEMTRRFGNAGWVKRYTESKNTESFLKNVKYEIEASVDHVEEFLYALLYKMEQKEISSEDATEFLEKFNILDFPHWKKSKIQLALKKARG